MNFLRCMLTFILCYGLRIISTTKLIVVPAELGIKYIRSTLNTFRYHSKTRLIWQLLFGQDTDTALPLFLKLYQMTFVIHLQGFRNKTEKQQV